MTQKKPLQKTAFFNNNNYLIIPLRKSNIWYIFSCIEYTLLVNIKPIIGTLTKNTFISFYGKIKMIMYRRIQIDKKFTFPNFPFNIRN